MTNPGNDSECGSCFMDDLMHGYLDDMQDRLDKLDNYISNLNNRSEFTESFKSLMREVHSIKGSAGCIGLPEFSVICHQLEDELKHINRNVGSFNGKLIPEYIGYIDLLGSAIDARKNGADISRKIEKDLDSLRTNIHGNKLCRVMVVEQSQTMINVCLYALKKFPVQSTVVNTGYKALGRLLHEKFDVLITALQVSPLNGDALIGSIKISNSRNPEIKTILMTSNINELVLIPALKPDHIVIKNNLLGKSIVEKMKIVL